MDLLHDLRARRLLPLVALLVVAIVATPFLLSSPDPELSPTTGQTGLIGTPDGRPPQLTVVAETPVGLRDYRTRLRRLSAKDPFRQHFTAPKVAAANLGTPGGSAATTTVPTVAPTADLPPAPSTTVPASIPEPSSSPDAGGNGNHGGGSSHGGDPSPTGPNAPGSVTTNVVDYEIDVSVGPPGKTRVRRGVRELTMLPNRKHPVAIFMGVSHDAKRALFRLSTDVTSVFGDTHCRFGKDRCQLVELERGFPISITYGAKDNQYQIAVRKIHETTRNAATGGKPSKPTALGRATIP